MNIQSKGFKQIESNIEEEFKKLNKKTISKKKIDITQQNKGYKLDRRSESFRNVKLIDERDKRRKKGESWYG